MPKGNRIVLIPPVVVPSAQTTDVSGAAFPLIPFAPLRTPQLRCRRDPTKLHVFSGSIHFSAMPQTINPYRFSPPPVAYGRPHIPRVEVYD